MCTTYEV